MNPIQNAKDFIFDRDISIKTKLLYAGAIIFLGIMLVLTVIYAAQEFRYEKVPAEITNTYTQSDDDSIFYYIVYKFEYNGSEYSTTRRAGYTEYYNAKEGKEAVIQIDPKSPFANIVKGGGIIYAVIDTLAVLAILGLSFISKKEKEQSLLFRNRSSRNNLYSEFEIEQANRRAGE